MKGKIDKDGNLLIERGGFLRTASCPFAVWTISQNAPIQQSNEFMPCGHWCPLFGEPEFIDGHPRFIDGHPRLSLCRKVLEFVSLVDERGQE